MTYPLYRDDLDRWKRRTIWKEVLKHKYTDEEADYCQRSYNVFLLSLLIMAEQEKAVADPHYPISHKWLAGIQAWIDELKQEIAEYDASRPAFDPMKETYLCPDCIWIDG